MKTAVQEGAESACCRAVASAEMSKVRAMGADGTRRACRNISCAMRRAGDSESQIPLGTCAIPGNLIRRSQAGVEVSDIACLSPAGQGDCLETRTSGAT